jgi:hypothetical protein
MSYLDVMHVRSPTIIFISPAGEKGGLWQMAVSSIRCGVNYTPLHTVTSYLIANFIFERICPFVQI